MSLATEYAQEDMMRMLSVSPPARVVAVERRVGIVERLLNALPIPRGVMIGDGRHLVNWDKHGRLWLMSTDSTVTLERVVGKPQGVNIKVASQGCADVIKTVAGDTGSEDASGCDTTLTLTGAEECGGSSHIVTEIVAGIIAKIQCGLLSDADKGSEAGIAKMYSHALGRCVTWTVYETSDFAP